MKKFLWLALAFSLAAGLFQAHSSWRTAQASAQAMMIGGLDKRAEPEAESPSEPAPALPEEAAHLADLDLAALQAVNGEVMGWLEIPGTQLSYPLVQGTDNQFYLSHNWKGESSGAGSVFLEETNPHDLTGFHLIAYAHRMRDGSMFGSLKYYSDLDYCQEHPRIYLAAQDGVREYTIFAAYEASVTGMVYRLDLETGGLEEEFVQSCLDNSVIDTGVIPTPGAQILTLSTCTGRGYEARWVVQGVLTGMYELSQGNMVKSTRLFS